MTVRIQWLRNEEGEWKRYRFKAEPIKCPNCNSTDNEKFKEHIYCLKCRRMSELKRFMLIK